MTEQQKTESVEQHKMINLNDVAIAVGAIDVASNDVASYLDAFDDVRTKIEENVDSLTGVEFKFSGQAAKQPEEPPVVDAEVVEEAPSE